MSSSAQPFRVYAPPALRKALTADEYVVVGSLARVEQTDKSFVLEYALLDCFPCEDLGVVNEQIECIERVLPCGLHVLGVAVPNAAAMTRCCNELKGNALLSELVCLRYDLAVLSAAKVCRPSQQLPVTEGDLLFHHLRCSLLPDIPPFPLVVSVPGGKPRIIDLSCARAIGFLDDLNLLSEAEATQLGVPRGEKLSVLVVACLAHASGVSIRDALLDTARDALTTGRTESVYARSLERPHLLYCFRSSHQSNDLPKDAFEEFQGLVEDGVGERITRCQLVCVGSASHTEDDKDAKTPAKDEEEKPLAQNHERSSTALLVAVVIVLIGVLIACLYA